MGDSMTIDTSKEAVERLMDGVTPGPWTREAQSIYHSGGYGLVAHLKAHEWRRDWPTLERDGDFVAAARDLVPALAAERDHWREGWKQLAGEFDANCKAINQATAEISRLTAELAALRAGQDALVATAYEAAVQALILDLGHLTEDQSLTGPYALRRAMEAIRALTTADATAALDAKLRAERNKVRREVSDMLMRRPVPPDDVSTVIACRDAILAMIEPEGK